jgi:hypothetical protein
MAKETGTDNPSDFFSNRKNGMDRSKSGLYVTYGSPKFGVKSEIALSSVHE